MKETTIRVANGYGHIGTARTAEIDGRLYLIVDLWCGEGVEGECFREHQCVIPPSRLAEVEQMLCNQDMQGLQDFAFLQGALRLDRTERRLRNRLERAKV